MEAIGLALIGAALAVAGYFGRRAVERSAEAERLRREALQLEINARQRDAAPRGLLILLIVGRG